MKYDYKRVVILGVDGAGNFFSQAKTPNMDKIFANGATTYDALTSIPTISAECWGSMLLGITPEVHGLTNGSLDIPYDVDSIFPSIFRITREKFPEAQLASFCNWNPINTGIIENNLNVVKDTSGDAELTDKICAYLEKNEPTLLFVQYDEVDGAGHHSGYGTPDHIKQIEITDGYIGRIYDVLAKRGMIDDTLFIVSADHGGLGHGHGGTSDTEKLIFIGFAGKTVNHYTIKDLGVRDIAAVSACALGLKQPDSWTARVPEGLFTDYKGGGERPAGKQKS